MNVAEALLARISAEAGTDATAGFEEVRVTVVSAATAPDMVTVPVDVYPPIPDVGVAATDDSTAAVTFSEAVFVIPFNVAEITLVVSTTG